MGLPWIPIYTNLPNHPKSIALGAVLNEKRAWSYMVQVWLWAADHAQDGRLSGRNGAVLIEHAAGWEGKRGALVEAALEAGFLDREEDGTFVFHDWDVTNGAHVAKRKRDAERQKERRLRLVRDESTDVRVTSDGHPRDGAGERERETEREDDHVGLETDHPLAEDLRAVWNAERALEMPEWRPGKSPKRRKAVAARLKERPDIAEWRVIIQRLARSDFARGLVPGRDGRRWVATPAFLIQPDAADKVLEGTYDNRNARPEASHEHKLKQLF